MISALAGAPILPADLMRAAEARAFARGVTQDELMERAGLAVAQAARRWSNGAPIIVLAGPGNNGGDAYAAACHLREWGHDLTLAALGPPRAGAAARMAARWSGAVVPFEQIEAPSGYPTPDYLLIDGLFGIGAQRALELDPVRGNLIRLAPRCIAIDLPTGIDADTGKELDGQPIGLPRRDWITVALGALKPAHLLNPDACGTILLDELGLRTDIEDARREHGDHRWQMLEQPRIIPPLRSDHKYRNKVSIVAGAMPGAARLAARAALSAGAGYVQLIGDKLAPAPLDAIVQLPGAALGEVLGAGGMIVIGPGLGRDSAARDLLDAALASDADLILDGDALTLLGEGAAERLRAREWPRQAVLTPHAGEFARMFGEPGANRIAATLAAAQASNATIVHKGATTVIARRNGTVRVSNAGSPWLATAGTGDVLAGAIAVRGPEQGVWLHARASQLAGAAFSADGLIGSLPTAVAECG